MGLIWFLLMCTAIGVLSGVAVGLFSISALFVPACSSKPDLRVVREKVDENPAPGKKRILIAYNTKNGCSVDIGLKIHEVLVKNGFSVDFRYIPYILNDDIGAYDYYIVGGAIYWSWLMKDTRDFLTKHLETFKTKPTALFMVCGKMCNEFAPKLTGDLAKWRRLSLDYLEPMFAMMPGLKEHLVDVGTFAGNIHFKFMNLPEFIMMGLQMYRTGLKQGDYMNLARVEAWAEEISGKLAGKGALPAAT